MAGALKMIPGNRVTSDSAAVAGAPVSSHLWLPSPVPEEGDRRGPSEPGSLGTVPQGCGHPGTNVCPRSDLSEHNSLVQLLTGRLHGVSDRHQNPVLQI